MSLEAIGSIGSAIGSVSSGIGKASASLDAMFGPKMGPIGVPSFAKEGPANFADMKNTMPLQISSKPVEVINFQKPVEALDAQAAVAEVEAFLAQAKTGFKQEPVNTLNEAMQPAWEVVFPQAEPMVLPRVEPLPQIMASPALKPAIDAQAGQAVAVQPALQEQEEEVEEIVEEKVQKKQEEVLEEEETEESSLKDVVDEEVFNVRLEEFGMAADLVGIEAEKESLEELDGDKIVKHIPAETAVNRSGIIKKQGPDGSREETISEVASRRFRSVKEAKEKIAAIIAQKVPVKRAKEGKAVGYEAVARVLKYFFAKVKPTEQLVTRVVKKQKTLSVVSVVKPDVKELRIEDLGLAEVFPKAA